MSDCLGESGRAEGVVVWRGVEGWREWIEMKMMSNVISRWVMEGVMREMKNGAVVLPRIRKHTMEFNHLLILRSV